MERLDAIVVGGGHAGLAVSQRLAAAGTDHVVLERGRIGESWRSQRWDTFALNTPSWANRLPADTDADDLRPRGRVRHGAGLRGPARQLCTDLEPARARGRRRDGGQA
jgi:cation diffusion facilitator CzcD-associated flavoprotein CzcO